MQLSKKALAVLNYLEEQFKKYYETQREKGISPRDITYLIYMGELRDRFSSEFLDEFFNYYTEITEKGWDWSAPSHTQIDDPEWVKDNVNNLYKHRGSLAYYIYKRAGNRAGVNTGTSAKPRSRAKKAPSKK